MSKDMGVDRFEEFDGAYVLGALSERDSADFEAHLETCAQCRRRVDELVGLPGLLAGLPEAAFAVEDPPAPEGLLLDLQRAVRAERRRRWIYTGAVAAVLAAVLITVTALVAGSGRPAARPTAAAVAMHALRPAPIHIDAALTSVRWGTRIDLKCTYDYTATSDAVATYVLKVTDTSGATSQAGTWNVTPGRVTTFTSGTAVSLADIKSVEVDLSDGTALLALSP